MIKTYLMRRRSRVGESFRERDEPVPEAHLWRLTEGMVRSGRLRQVEMTEADFAEAVAKYCADRTEEIFARVGLAKFESETGDHGRPKAIPVTAPEPTDEIAAVTDEPAEPDGEGNADDTNGSAEPETVEEPDAEPGDEEPDNDEPDDEAPAADAGDPEPAPPVVEAPATPRRRRGARVVATAPEEIG